MGVISIGSRSTGGKGVGNPFWSGTSLVGISRVGVAGTGVFWAVGIGNGSLKDVQAEINMLTRKVINTVLGIILVFILIRRPHPPVLFPTGEIEKGARC